MRIRIHSPGLNFLSQCGVETGLERSDFPVLVVDAKSYGLRLLQVRAEYRQIFLELGFTEMAANNYVESSFWNFDALFQPQQHPARDAHDTFFIADPATSNRYRYQLKLLYFSCSVGGMT